MPQRRLQQFWLAQKRPNDLFVFVFNDLDILLTRFGQLWPNLASFWPVYAVKCLAFGQIFAVL